MSIKLTLEDDGQVRVSVDRGGERAVSDMIYPVDLVREVVEIANLDVDELHDELTDGGEPEELTEPMPEPGIDESAPPEEEDPVTRPNLHPEEETGEPSA